MSFYDVIHSYGWGEIQKEIGRRSREDVRRALAARTLGLDDLMGLLSPHAEPFLEEMAQSAHRLTLQRFGRVMGMFAPLYLSNVCTNRCVYCGFNAGNTITRVTLTPEEREYAKRIMERFDIAAYSMGITREEFFQGLDEMANNPNDPIDPQEVERIKERFQ